MPAGTRLIRANDPPFKFGVGAGFFSAGLFNGVAGNLVGQVFVTNANDVRVVKFELPCSITISKLTAIVQAGVAASLVSFAIYNSDGTKKLVDSGTLSSAVNSTTPSNTFTAVTLAKGVYYFAYTCTSNAVTTNGYNQLNNGSITTIYNLNSVRTGVAANPAVAGVLPATLGVITTSAFNVAVVFWE